MDKVKTGDVVMCSANNPTGIFLRTFVASKWSHSAVAVRINKNNEISLTDEGDLYFFETNTGVRYDHVFGDNITGAGYSSFDFFSKRYSKIIVRELNSYFRTPELARLTKEFVDKMRGKKFQSNPIPFVKAWLGVSFSKNIDPDEMFCSELTAHYYFYCFSSTFENNLNMILGTHVPEMPEMYIPSHFEIESSPDAPIFSNIQYTLFTAESDLIYVILQPFLITLIIILFIWMLLPKYTS